MVATVNSTGTSTGVVITPDSSGVLALQTGGTTAVTVDTSQNVGIGTTSPTSILNLRANTPILQFSQNTGNSDQGLQFGTTGGTSYGAITHNATTGQMRYVSGIASGNGYYHVWIQDGSERMRIDTSGNLLVGTTSQVAQGKINVVYSNTVGQGLCFNENSGSGLTRDAVRFQTSGTQVGSISVSTTATSYVTSSDYRLKNTVAPMTGALSKVIALKPVTYKWNADGSDGEGFIAHELAEVVPQCVIGEKDAVDAEGNPQYQGIDTSFLVATLTAALQETKALIDTQAETINALTARIVALEGK